MKTNESDQTPQTLLPALVGARTRRMAKGPALAALLVAVATACHGATLVSGNVSGTWPRSGSPYILIDNTTVPNGATLRIDPGVAVQIPSGSLLSVYGALVAVGTGAERISFGPINATSFWNTVLIEDQSRLTSRIEFCDFRNATNALSVRIINQNATMNIAIVNCRFTNCMDYAISCSASGYVYQDLGGFHYLTPTLRVETRNCLFSNCAGGTRYESAGAQNVHPWYGFIGGLVSIYPSEKNNIYNGITGAALYFAAEGHTAEASGKVVNCTFNNVGYGVEHHAYFSLDVQNSIFSGCGYGLFRDTTAGQAGYNCFWNVQTNFVGYSPNYGSVVMANQNGTPCDVAFNIFQDPSFLGSRDFHLSTTSPCVDAGDPSSAAADGCLPPSLGSAANDMGAYGGPDACSWYEGVAPVVIRQPQAQTACLGRTVSFSVQAAGTGPLSFQWHFNGAPLAGATSTNLTLANVEADQAGAYSVSISNTFGEVTSLPATLAVSDGCLEIQMYAGLSISGQPGATYELRATTGLTNTDFSTWTLLATNVMPESGWFYLDKESPFSSKRFYGVRRIRP